MPRQTFLARLAFCATLLALGVVVLGAYVRLSNAGLGCPDWPGCYGHYKVPETHQALQAYPDNPLESHKAWKEMAHRYLAGFLGLLILALALVSFKTGRKIPWILLLIVCFQAALGRWTVTLKLHPLVVMAHLMGGLATLSLLWVFFLQLCSNKTEFSTPKKLSNNLMPRVYAGLVLLVFQIALGGWMSANYASLACPDFPTCLGSWLPPMDIRAAFALWQEFGHNYEGGALHNEARVAIHWIHRLGALVVFLYWTYWGSRLLRFSDTRLKRAAQWILTILFLQIALGVSNVLFQLPLVVATAHNAGAALLLLGVVTALLRVRQIVDRGGA